MNVAARVDASQTKPTNLRGRIGAFMSSKDPKTTKRRRIVIAAIAVAVVALVAWMLFGGSDLPRGFGGGNGRLEANEVYVSAKYPGRIREVLVDEGEMVEVGQVVARMDVETLEAQLRQALAQIRQSESNHQVAQAQIAVRQANYTFANQQYRRSSQLVRGGAVSEQEAQVDRAASLSAQAELTGARAAAVEAASAIEAAKAEADRLRAEIDDSVLVAPIRGRVETRLAEPGEVLDAGGRVFSLIDLSDVYMFVFLPERVAGRVAVGSEARIVLDAAPQYPITGFVSFVSPMAQFTPRSVETEEERHNLTFRVKLQVPRERLRQYEPLVKTGMPGMGYVRYENSARWPANLAGGRPPPPDLWATTGAAPAPQQQPTPSGGANEQRPGGRR